MSSTQRHCDYRITELIDYRYIMKEFLAFPKGPVIFSKDQFLQSTAWYPMSMELLLDGEWDELPPPPRTGVIDLGDYLISGIDDTDAYVDDHHRTHVFVRDLIKRPGPQPADQLSAFPVPLGCRAFRYPASSVLSLAGSSIGSPDLSASTSLAYTTALPGSSSGFSAQFSSEGGRSHALSSIRPSQVPSSSREAGSSSVSLPSGFSMHQPKVSPSSSGPTQTCTSTDHDPQGEGEAGSEDQTHLDITAASSKEHESKLSAIITSRRSQPSSLLDLSDPDVPQKPAQDVPSTDVQTAVDEEPAASRSQLQGSHASQLEGLDLGQAQSAATSDETREYSPGRPHRLSPWYMVTDEGKLDHFIYLDSK